jgi:hypothetical protein
MAILGAPANIVTSGHFVATLGGVYVPYLSEQHEGHFELIDHANVECIITKSKLSPEFHVQRLMLESR